MSRSNSSTKSGSRRLRSSKTGSLRVSTIVEERPCTDDDKRARNVVVDAFFQSFYAALVTEKKPLLEPDSDSLTSPELASEGSSGAATIQSLSTSSSCSSSCACKWRLVFTSGDIYEGQLSEGDLMEGAGTFYWSDGSVYQGQFRDGYPNGRGRLVLPDLSTYEGQVVLGFFHGRGTFSVKATELIYDGQWKLSKKNGRGWLRYDTDDYYEGDFESDMKQGQGYRHYKNGDRYRGGFVNDRAEGEGCMMWHNNDQYYTGGWMSGIQNGYGEYTWTVLKHSSLVFPNYNWYKGNWVNGTRCGTGIMNFGLESGARLAGVWQDNRKHGPGVMICGNGIVLERNPLFMDDKPAVYVKKDSSGDDAVDKKDNALSTYRSICTQISYKTNLESLLPDQLLDVTRSGTCIKTKQYVKLLERQSFNAPTLKIPVHTVAHDVDLGWFVNDYMRADVSAFDIGHISQLSLSARKGSSSSILFSMNTELSNQPQFATGELSNLIINYLPQLRHIYNAYATLGVAEGDVTFATDPVLTRFFLWQLYRDVGVAEKGGVSITDINDNLMKNPNGCLEQAHDPWEPIYFWQFVQTLVGVACMVNEDETIAGSLYRKVRSFFENKLIINAGQFCGNCLTGLKDLVSIEAVYGLYKSIGEPHSLDKFLKNTCLRKGETVPCYKTSPFDEPGSTDVENGQNVTILNNQLFFAKTSTRNLKRTDDERIGLFAFSSLGRRTILKSVAKICPLVGRGSGRYDLTYRLSFIEFYEILLVLAYEKVESERLELVKAELKTSSATDLKSAGRLTSRMSTFSAKKGKKIKK